MRNFTSIFIMIVNLAMSINAIGQNPVWERYSEGLDTYDVMSFTHVGSIIYAGTNKGGVFKSSDNGSNWASMPLHNTLKQTSTWCMASIDTFIFAGQRGGGILRTSVNGTAWTIKNTGLTNKIVQDLIAVDTILYVATYGGGIFYSTNLGNNWSVLYNNNGMEDHKIYALANNTNYLYAGSAGISSLPDTGVAFRTQFGGSNWFRVNNGFIRNGAHLDSVFSMDANDSLVYAGTDDVGFYRTDNNGDDWKLVDSNTGDIHAIKLVGQNVYYGTVWGGVHSSFDNGKTFAANNTGLKFGPTSIPYLVKDFLVMDTLIFAATDIGVFRQAIPNILTSANKISSPKNKLNIYPNPTSGSTNFKFTLTHSELVCITIYDYVGKEINTLINTFVEPGEHTYNINTRNLDAGIYYVKFVSGNEVNVYSLISLK